MMNTEITTYINARWMMREDIINLLSYSCQTSQFHHLEDDNENERHTMNESNMKTHEWEVKILVFDVLPHENISLI